MGVREGELSKFETFTGLNNRDREPLSADRSAGIGSAPGADRDGPACVGRGATLGCVRAHHRD